ncbi:hypothetical protein LCGC14_1642020 [marine sediment metagenome]|uniref:Uncharacterized protein n=1 Tax=marine sediment metagenome TaxID=412755 RepID=A0A0F9HZ99_9ZZZZ
MPNMPHSPARAAYIKREISRELDGQKPCTLRQSNTQPGTRDVG